MMEIRVPPSLPSLSMSKRLLSMRKHWHGSAGGMGHTLVQSGTPLWCLGIYDFRPVVKVIEGPVIEVIIIEGPVIKVVVIEGPVIEVIVIETLVEGPVVEVIMIETLVERCVAHSSSVYHIREVVADILIPLPLLVLPRLFLMSLVVDQFIEGGSGSVSWLSVSSPSLYGSIRNDGCSKATQVGHIVERVERLTEARPVAISETTAVDRSVGASRVVVPSFGSEGFFFFSGLLYWAGISGGGIATSNRSSNRRGFSLWPGYHHHAHEERHIPYREFHGAWKRVEL